MSVEIACPHCSSRFKAPSTAIGKTVRCPKCKNQFVATVIGSQPVLNLSETDLSPVQDQGPTSPFDFDAIPAVAQAAARGSSSAPARPQPVQVPVPTPAAPANAFDFDSPPLSPPPPSAVAERPTLLSRSIPSDLGDDAQELPTKQRPTDRLGRVTGVPGISRLIIYRFVGIGYWLVVILSCIVFFTGVGISVLQAMRSGTFVLVIVLITIPFTLLALVVELLILRGLAEFIIVQFKIYDVLQEIRDQNQQKLSR